MVLFPHGNRIFHQSTQRTSGLSKGKVRAAGTLHLYEGLHSGFSFLAVLECSFQSLVQCSVTLNCHLADGDVGASSACALLLVTSCHNSCCALENVQCPAKLPFCQVLAWRPFPWQLSREGLVGSNWGLLPVFNNIYSDWLFPGVSFM